MGGLSAALVQAYLPLFANAQAWVAVNRHQDQDEP